MSTANAQCVTTSWDAATSQRVYTVTSVWTPGGCWGDVLIPATDFQAVVDAGGGSSGSGSSPFTAEEIAALKAQAIAGVPSGALSAEDGALLAWGVVLAWTAGWAARQMIRAFRGTSSDSGDHA